MVAGLGNVAAQLILTAAGYVTTVLLARTLGPAAFGVFGLVYSLLVAVELFGRFGIPTATTRRLAGAADPAPVCRSASALTLTSSLLLMALVWAAAPFAARLLDLADGAGLLRLAAVDIPFFAFYLLLLAVLAGRGRFLVAALLTCVYALVRLLGVFWVVLFRPTVEAALVANVAASVVVVVAGTAIVGLSALVPRLRGCRSLLAGASPVWIVNSLLVVLPQIGLWSIPILGSGGDRGAVGMYAAALALARVPHLIPLGLDPLLLQRLAAGRARGDVRTVAQDLEATTRFAIVVLVPACAVLALEAETIVTLLFGPAYGGAAGLVAVLALGLGLGHSLLAMLRTALVAVGDTAAATALVAGTFLALGATTALLVPLAGGSGAALATALVLPVAALVAARLLARRVGNPLRGVPVLRLAALVTGLALLGWLIPAQGPALFAELALLGLVWLTGVWRLRLLPGLFALSAVVPVGPGARRFQT